MKKALTGHLLTFVLFSVLVWYTAINPNLTLAVMKDFNPQSSDAEERDAEPDEQRDFTSIEQRRSTEPLTFMTSTSAFISDPDWPEIIGEDEEY